MKKITLCLMAICLSFTFLSQQLNAATTDETSSVVVTKSAESVEAAEAAEAQALLLRLEEIKAMDKSMLTAEEKKDLRNEVLAIKESLKEVSGGIYISAGVLLIILIVVLILVL